MAEIILIDSAVAENLSVSLHVDYSNAFLSKWHGVLCLSASRSLFQATYSRFSMILWSLKNTRAWRLFALAVNKGNHRKGIKSERAHSGVIYTAVSLKLSPPQGVKLCM